MFAWSKDYEQRICKGENGKFLIGEVTFGGRTLISYPLGVSNEQTIREIVTELKTMYSPLTMSGLSREHADTIERLFPGEIRTELLEGYSDYLYDLEKLTTLAGKKLHAKRNYINRFEGLYPEWVFEPISSANVSECLLTDGLWVYNKTEEDFDTIPGEVRALENALLNFCAMELDGGLIRLSPGGTVVAFTVGERICEDTYITHFEKALPDIDGAYQLINREFAKLIKEKYPAVHYVNREEDMGLENLRKSKRSYYPELMEDKYRVYFNN
jgi:hypothetical protein